MDVATADRFFSLMTLLTLGGVAGATVLRLAAFRLPSAARLDRTIWNPIGTVALWLAWLVALVSLLGSLYYSEIVGYSPCSLCWYQRIAMYPLVVILAVAAWDDDWGVRRYALPLVAVGGAFALYQYILGYFPDAEILGCTLDVSCTERYVWEFGFVDFPFMSLVAFLAIAALLLFPLNRRGDRHT
jgi:disulfide bond formation protein DsbB